MLFNRRLATISVASRFFRFKKERMKEMKKKIASLLLICVAMFAFVGCTPDSKAYLAESKKVSEWDKASVTGNMSFAFTDGNDKLSLPVEVKMDATALKGAPVLHYTLSFGNVNGTGNVTKDIATLSGKTIEYYLDGKTNKFFINKGLFLEMAKAGGETLPKGLSNLKEDFIALDLNGGFYGSTGADLGMTLAQNQAKSEEVMKLLEKVFNDFNHKALSVTKNANTYHYEVTGSELIDGGFAGVKHLIKKWPQVKMEVMPLLKELGIPVTTNDIVSLQKELGNIEKGLPEFKKGIEGSKIVVDTTFNGDSYTTKGKAFVNFQNTFKVEMNFDLTTTKNDALAISLPTSVRYFTPDEFFDLVAPKIAVGDEVIVEVDGDFLTDMGFAKDGRTLVPYRAFAEKIGASVAFNDKTKEVKVTKEGKAISLTLGKKEAVIDGKKVMLDVPTVVQAGRTYVPLRFIGENYGYKVSWNSNTRTASLEKKAA